MPHHMIMELSSHDHKFPFTTHTIMWVINLFNMKSLFWHWNNQYQPFSNFKTWCQSNIWFSYHPRTHLSHVPPISEWGWWSYCWLINIILFFNLTILYHPLPVSILDAKSICYPNIMSGHIVVVCNQCDN